MLALYLALKLGLPRPFWAIITSYVVSQPFSGATRSKAVYRVIGTFVGAVMTVLIVPRLVGYPVLLSVVFSVWIGVCLYVSLLDRTPRAYAFMLAGYSLPIIALPAMADISLFSVSSIFEVSLARVEEIVLGITCSALVHSLFWPKGIDRTVLDKLDGLSRDIRIWVLNILAGTDAERIVAVQRIAGTISELRMLSTHLPFDTSHLRWMAWLVQEFQNRCSTLIPVLVEVGDRLECLRQYHHGTLPLSWQKILVSIGNWVKQERRDSEYAIHLHRAIERIMPVSGKNRGHEEWLWVSLGMELQRLLNECERCFDLQSHIGKKAGKYTAAFGKRNMKGTQFHCSSIAERRWFLLLPLRWHRGFPACSGSFPVGL